LKGRANADYFDVISYHAQEMPMNPAEEFRRHAGECRRMALDTRDLESKASWDRLADRWVRCAELEEARPAP
jgi:hypothetical protein